MPRIAEWMKLILLLKMSVEPLRQRFSYGVYGRCATLVAGREAPDQLERLLAEKQNGGPAKQLEPALRSIESLLQVEWQGVMLLLANILILLTLRKVLRQAAALGLLHSDPAAADQPASPVAPPEQAEEPPEVQALQEVPYTDIRQRLSRAWIALHQPSPRSSIAQTGDGVAKCPLGEGSFAKVYAASYQGQLVVVKELKGMNSQQQRDPFMRRVSTAERARRRQQRVDALLKEAAMLEASRHSSVVQCLGICRDPPALILEWCYGGNLSEPTPKFLAAATAVEVVKLLHDAAAAVAHLHSQARRCGRALVHGDLRACNVLLKNRGGPDWGVKVADFGLAEWLKPDGTAVVPEVTNRCWVAPEVLKPQFGPYTVSRASEVYMFGMLMYEVLTGQSPYWEELVKLPAPLMQVAQHSWNICKDYGPLELPVALRFRLPLAVKSHLQHLYERCAGPDPETRPLMLEVVQELDTIIHLPVIHLLVAEGG